MLTKVELWRAHQLFVAIYEQSAAGCCWHILLDDGNEDDSSVEFCIERAVEEGHTACMALGPLMRRMSKTQRHKLGMNGYRSLAKEFGDSDEQRR